MEFVTDSTAQSYERVPYPSLSYSQSHPDRLATLATLLGMDPPPVERCRVLALGCASGGNVIPMAARLPESEFLGIDLAGRQIDQGQAVVESLGLTNIRLQQMDILEVTPELGQFDYVIAHGVYSWVPEPVREKLFEIGRQNLAPNGVAYVSYNTYPGWHMLNIVRDMMLYHTRDLDEPQERAAQAREMLDFLTGAVPAESSAYGSFIKMYADLLEDKLEGAGRPEHDAFLLHDELEDVNDPVYFHQFAEQAARHQLQYLAEAEFRKMVDSNFPPQVSKMLLGMAGDLVELEQYMDFLRNRSFRQSLLCHEGVTLNRKLKPARVMRLFASSCAEPVTEGEPDLRSDAVVKFRGADGAVLSIDHPLTKAAMRYLNERWPQAVPFDELVSDARQRLASDTGGPSERADEVDAEIDTEIDTEIDAQILGANLLKAYSYSAKLVSLHAYAPPVARTVSEQPEASPVARFQAQTSPIVTNMRHERVTLDGFNRYLLLQLDGTRDRAALLRRFLEGPVADGVLKVQRDGQPVKKPAAVERLLEEALERNLRGLAQTALLVR
jgi:methyltransferase-like protein/protein-L-isoaspartate O-methyltransferase